MVSKRPLLQKINTVTDRITRWLHYVGVSCLLVMVFLTTLDVGLRYLFNKPLSGAYELIEYMMVILVSFGLAYTANRHAHIRITVFTDMLPDRVQAALGCLTGLATSVFLSLVIWQSWVHALDKYSAGTESSVLHIPVYPFIVVVMVGMGAFVLNLFVEIFNNIKRVFKP